MAMQSLLRLLVLLAAAVSQVAAWVDCGDDASPSPPPSSSPSPSPLSNGGSNAAFPANLVALPRAAAPTGFASLSLGTSPRRPRGLCRGDFRPPRCLAELQEAVRTLGGGGGGGCPRRTRRAAVWLAGCLRRQRDDPNGNGTMYGMVQCMRETALDRGKRYRIILEIARGLLYLHEEQRPAGF